jgi:membrane-associated protease RseP (regulator of RpoE activity)
MSTLQALTGVMLSLSALLPGAPEEVRQEEKGTYLGALFNDRPAPAPTTPPRVPARGAPGVVITHVLPGSPAARAELRRGDVLLEYDHKAIRDGEHLAKLIRDDKPDRKVQLRLQRGLRVQTVDVTLALGPPLKLSSTSRGEAGEGGQGGREKGPAAVCLYAAPLESGKMQLTIEYTGAAGKREVVTCDGVATDLSTTLQKLPERERNLVRIALQRLRMLNSARAAESR